MKLSNGRFKIIQGLLFKNGIIIKMGKNLVLVIRKKFKKNYWQYKVIDKEFRNNHKVLPICKEH